MASLTAVRQLTRDAVLQDSLLERIERAALGHWDEWGHGGRRPNRLGALLHFRGHTQKSIVKLVHPSTGKLVAVAKVPGTPAATPLVKDEFLTLRRVSEELSARPDILAAVPKAPVSLEDGWRFVFLEAAVHGDSVILMAVQSQAARHTRKIERTLETCFEWLLDFHEVLATPVTGRQHGDFSVTNLFLEDGKKLAVLDWENFGKYPPCFDLFSLLLSCAFYAAESDSSEGAFDRLLASLMSLK